MTFAKRLSIRGNLARALSPANDNDPARQEVVIVIPAEVEARPLRRRPLD